MTTVSVDLAYKSYKDNGVAVLSQTDAVFEKVELEGKPDADALAKYFVTLCEKHAASVLLIDGPQAWKDPDNGLVHSRICERALNTPGKTGLPFTSKPRNSKPRHYLPFIEFSIQVFNALHDLGWRRFSGEPFTMGTVAVECFPTSAWRSIGMKPLPSKRKASIRISERRLQRKRSGFRHSLRCVFP
jgi:hypothetical protein